jgi:hypothetical protein
MVVTWRASTASESHDKPGGSSTQASTLYQTQPNLSLLYVYQIAFAFCSLEMIRNPQGELLILDWICHDYRTECTGSAPTIQRSPSDGSVASLRL